MTTVKASIFRVLFNSFLFFVLVTFHVSSFAKVEQEKKTQISESSVDPEIDAYNKKEEVKDVQAQEVISKSAGVYGFEVGLFPTLGAYAAFPTKFHFHFYIDLKVSWPIIPDNQRYKFSKSYASDVLGDTQIGTKKELGYVNLGIAHFFTRSFGPYFQLGIGTRTTLAKFRDLTHILGSNGIYYVEETGEKLAFNAGVGIILVVGGVNLKMAYETLANQGTFGIGGTY